MYLIKLKYIETAKSEIEDWLVLINMNDFIIRKLVYNNGLM